MMKKTILAVLMAAGLSVPAYADPPSWSSGHARQERGVHEHRRQSDFDNRRYEHHRRDDGRDRHDRSWERSRWSEREWRHRHDDDRRWRDSRHWQRDDWRTWRHYDYYRPDPRYGRYYADRYYRDGRYYSPRRLGWNDRIYRGYDGRYYCRRSDGTTGLILGAIGGGLLGDAIAPGDSRTVGALIGGSLGALLGREIDRGGARCR